MTDRSRVREALAEMNEDYPDWEWVARTLADPSTIILTGEKCETCDGRGHYPVQSTRGDGYETDDITCPSCHGTGTIPPLRKMQFCVTHMAPRLWTGEDHCVYRASYPESCEFKWMAFTFSDAVLVTSILSSQRATKAKATCPVCGGSGLNPKLVEAIANGVKRLLMEAYDIPVDEPTWVEPSDNQRAVAIAALRAFLSGGWTE